MIWVVGWALAADEPCYGHAREERLSSDHFWVEWSGSRLREERAEAMLEAAELARTTWLDLGYGFTDQPIVIEVLDFGDGGSSGLTTTRPCGEQLVPFIQIYLGRWDTLSLVDLVTHETAHAAQYADMGAYTDSVASWAWWMEGHATWLTPHASSQWDAWARSADGYTSNIELPLQHGVEGYLATATSDHMYGTTLLVHALAELTSPEVVRDTWTWGGPRSGQPIQFIDAIDAVTDGFVPLWTDYLTHLPTLNFKRGRSIQRPLAHIAEELPLTATHAGAGGLGVAIMRFPASLGDPDHSLSVQFDGGDQPWLVVLSATAPNESVVERVAFYTSDGQAEGWISSFDSDIWLVASPLSDARDLQPFTFTAELTDRKPPMDEATVYLPSRAEFSEEGCACAHAGRPWALAALLPLLAARRRYSKAHRASNVRR